MKLSVLMVNWNGGRYLEDCLASVAGQVSGAYEAIVVDNGSTDGSGERAAERFPWVKLVRSEVNLGFTGGNNLAARHATGDVLLLLNCDTVLLADPAPLAACVLNDAAIGCAGAKMCNGAGVETANCGHFPSPLRLLLFSSLFWRPGRARYGMGGVEARSVDWVEGSWMLIRRDVWEAVGGFDTGIFLYGEDVDLCRRMRDRGKRVVQAELLAYRHYTGWSASRLPYQYAGFRRYHCVHSGWIERTLAETVLYCGLQARIVCYGLLGLLSGRRRLREKTRALLQVNRFWSRLAEPGFRLP